MDIVRRRTVQRRDIRQRTVMPDHRGIRSIPKSVDHSGNSPEEVTIDSRQVPTTTDEHRI
jgi:hypothetical protein